MYDLGSRIRKLREKRGLSQKQLAEKIGRSSSAISSYECDAQVPPTDVLLSIATALNAPINYFVDNGDAEYYSIEGLNVSQKAFLELLFQEFSQSTSQPDGTLSIQQAELVNRLLSTFHTT